MPRIFDNIDLSLLPALQQTMAVADRSDFCVGYFNLRGWRLLHDNVDRWAGGDGRCCRLLVGMQRLPEDELREWLGMVRSDDELDLQSAARLKRQLAAEFRHQLTIGIPTDTDEASLRKLAAQIRARKVVVKLHLRHTLHAKLYLLFRPDPINPIVGYVGSSNLTLSGLAKQGELNVDVLEIDACEKLARWFNDRWGDRWSIDISDELAEIIEKSWAGATPIPPYHIYLKIAYHLSREARKGLSEFRIPREFGNRLFDFQAAAVRIAARHLNRRGGVLIGDVVGLGKTLMATALAKIFQEDHLTEALIICPKNLVKMWEDYCATYLLSAKVLSLSRALAELPELRRYRLLILDESHNLRNPEGKRYRAVRDYIERNECRCILLSATPYNKTYLDLSAQLRLFVPEGKDLGVRPERLLAEVPEHMFLQRFQCPVRSIAAFEKSTHADDWRELMRLYMVRRTRGFIIENYAQVDAANGRKYLLFEDGTRSYFPKRVPRTLKFEIDDNDPTDPYARLYSDYVVKRVAALNLPRYGMGNYEKPAGKEPRRGNEEKTLEELSRAGARLKGFCVTNLFKRLESGGPAFIQSIGRHILRNFVFAHAIENGLDLPIGTQNAEMLDTRLSDEDLDGRLIDEDGDESEAEQEGGSKVPRTEQEFRRAAKRVYERYASEFKPRFKWLRPALFIDDLGRDLLADGRALIEVLGHCGEWNPENDSKLNALARLIASTHKNEKLLVFTQFADTARYLEAELDKSGHKKLVAVTGDTEDPTARAWRFSPESNGKRSLVPARDEYRVLVTTDVLSEGQNLQDCAIVVNYDLPWAIIRLIQRAGRVDRIGQHAERILCYSFLPADGVERIINLRGRVAQRLRDNAEVVGSDEFFFEEHRDRPKILDLYHEKAAVLEEGEEGEVDLASYAYQIWNNATAANPALRRAVEELPDVVYSTKENASSAATPDGVIVYLRTADDNDALARLNAQGEVVTQSQLAILDATACSADTPAIDRDSRHHELVARGVEHLKQETAQIGGQLGRRTGARYRTYERLSEYAKALRARRDLFSAEEYVLSIEKVVEEVYKFPLQQTATDTINRQLRAGLSDEELARLVLALRDDNRLCQVQEEAEAREPRIICSLGLFPRHAG
jgi:superfamily II DNA or RNA helicase